MDKVIGALAWPLVFLILALVALMMFRERAGELFHGALSRVRKVSLPGGIGIEFAELLETRVGLTGSSLPDIEAIGGPSVFTPASGTKGILQLLNVNAGVRSSYVVLDLQLGRRWITSRLYVFCALFEGLPGVRHVVFVETASDTRRRFIGVAGPTSVRVHLGNRDPRLVKRLRHGVRVGI